MKRAVTAFASALVLSLLLVASLAAGVNRWTSEGPFGGRIEGMALDAFDPDLVYAATLDDLYRSEDGGDTWVRALESRGTLDEVVTSPARGGAAYFVSFHEGIFRTSDRGKTWDRILDCFVSDLAFDPNAPDVLLAATLAPGLEEKPRCGGLQLSPDGGETWNRLPVPGFFVDGLAIDPNDSELIYAAATDGIYASEDRGSRFSRTGAPLGIYREILFDPTDESRLLTRGSGGVYASDDGGDSWDLILSSGDLPLYDLAAHPQTGRLWASGESMGLVTSDDGGASWSVRSDQLPGTPLVVGLDPSDPDRVFAGTDLGVFRTTDGGSTWQASHAGLDAVRVQDVLPETPLSAPGATAYEVDERPLLLATSVGVLRGGRDNPQDLTAGLPPGVERLAAGNSPSQLVYAAAPTQLWRSEDGGVAWTKINETVASLKFAVFPSDPSTLLVGTLRSLAVSFDAGDTWNPVEVPDFQFFQDVAIGLTEGLDPRAWVILDGAMYVSDDLIEFVPSPTPPPGAPAFLQADPRHPGRLFARTSEGWFRSLDSGTTWEAAGVGLPDPEENGEFTPFPKIEFHPGGPDLLYAATSEGVLTSIDGGDTWADLGSELRGVHVHDVEIDPQDGNRLLAGTEQGLYTFERVAELPLRDGRFRVEVEWKDYEGIRGAGLVATVPDESAEGPVPLRTRDSTIFRFFGEENWEAQLKVLDGRPINGHFWVFFSAATNVGYELRVSDTVCGGTRTYGKAEGPPAPALTHTEAFPACPGTGSAPSCEPGPGAVCLGPEGRFQAELEWSFEGEEGQASQVTIPEAGLARSEDSGVFRFFGPGNWELLVKVLDGCAINDRYWVFAAASTDVEYTLRVTDTLETGGETAIGASTQLPNRVYQNPLGRRAPAINDLDAFSGCDLR